MSATTKGAAQPSVSKTSTKTSSPASTATSTTTSASYKELIVEQRERILLIKFNRAATKNALNRRAYYELVRALNEAAQEPQITIVAITGGGGAGADTDGDADAGAALGLGDTFSAGNDLTQLRSFTDPAHYFRGANFVLRRLVATFVHFPKVLVALVNGPCIGIGFTLAALCDVVYATEAARFEAPFTRLGICPEAGSSYTLPLALGRVKAAEVLLFGASLSAAEALQFGFVARLFENNKDLEWRLWPQLCEWSRLPAQSLRVSKKLLQTRERQEVLRALLAECNELEPLRYGETHLSALADFWNRKTNKSKL